MGAVSGSTTSCLLMNGHDTAFPKLVRYARHLMEKFFSSKSVSHQDDERYMNSLLELARDYFGSLTEEEEEFFYRIGQDGLVNLNGGTIRAECLAWLCSTPSARELLNDKGLRIQDVNIKGHLNLNYIHFDKPLIFKKASIEGFSIKYAEVYLLALLEGTKICDSFEADGLKLEHDLIIESSDIDCQILLAKASINGHLKLYDCKINKSNRIGYAIKADGISVSGNIHMRKNDMLDQLVCNGYTCFDGAFIAGVFEIKEIAFNANAENNKVFSCDFAKIGQSFHFVQSVIIGQTSLVGVEIGGDLKFTKSEFSRGGEVELDEPILLLDAANIAHDLFLHNGFRAAGIVSLIGTKVQESLCIREIIPHPNFSLDLRFASAQILVDDPQSWPNAGNLRLNGFVYQLLRRKLPKEKTSLFCHLKHRFALHCVDMSDSLVNSCTPDSCETQNRSYEPTHEICAHLDWLGRQNKEEFAFQAYDILAAALKRGGREELARTILVRKYLHRTQFKKFWVLSALSIPWDYLLFLTIGYGYRPWRALCFSLFWIILGAVLFDPAYHRNLIVASGYSSIEVYHDPTKDDNRHWFANRAYCIPLC